MSENNKAKEPYRSGPALTWTKIFEESNGDYCVRVTRSNGVKAGYSLEVGRTPDKTREGTLARHVPLRWVSRNGWVELTEPPLAPLGLLVARAELTMLADAQEVENGRLDALREKEKRDAEKYGRKVSPDAKKRGEVKA